jgi:hypothetical protein
LIKPRINRDISGRFGGDTAAHFVNSAPLLTAQPVIEVRIMVRVRIWVSASQETKDAFVLERIGATGQYYAFQRPIGGLDWLGDGYPGDLLGFEGTFYDLPRGFPTNNSDAALRAGDASVSKAMRLLIRSSFPLRPRRQPVFEMRRIA